MTEHKRDKRAPDEEAQRRERGQPGGGKGRMEEVAGSGVYPASGPLPKGEAEIRAPASWGQGKRGAAGYEDHGDSELHVTREEAVGRTTWSRGVGEQAAGEVARQRCFDVMTDNPVCCLPDDPVDRVAQLMKTEDVGSLPVVDDLQNRRLLGIVTDRDLALQVVAEGHDPHSTTVATVMTHKPITCRPNDSLNQAFDRMARHQIRRLPVVDDEGRILGIIAQADIATRTEAPRQTAAVVEEISKPGAPA